MKFEKKLYRALGAPGSLEQAKAEAAILDILGETDTPLTVDAITAKVADLKPMTIRRALETMTSTHALLRAGAGKRGSPHTYALPHSRAEVSFQTSNPRVPDEKKPMEVAGALLY